MGENDKIGSAAVQPARQFEYVELGTRSRRKMTDAQGNFVRDPNRGRRAAQDTIEQDRQKLDESWRSLSGLMSGRSHAASALNFQKFYEVLQYFRNRQANFSFSQVRDILRTQLKIENPADQDVYIAILRGTFGGEPVVDATVINPQNFRSNFDAGLDICSSVIENILSQGENISLESLNEIIQRSPLSPEQKNWVVKMASALFYAEEQPPLEGETPRKFPAIRLEIDPATNLIVAKDITAEGNEVPENFAIRMNPRRVHMAYQRYRGAYNFDLYFSLLERLTALVQENPTDELERILLEVFGIRDEKAVQFYLKNVSPLFSAKITHSDGTQEDVTNVSFKFEDRKLKLYIGDQPFDSSSGDKISLKLNHSSAQGSIDLNRSQLEQVTLFYGEAEGKTVSELSGFNASEFSADTLRLLNSLFYIKESLAGGGERMMPVKWTLDPSTNQVNIVRLNGSEIPGDTVVYMDKQQASDILEWNGLESMFRKLDTFWAFLRSNTIRSDLFGRFADLP